MRQHELYHLTWLMLLYYIVKVKKHWKCDITAGYYQTKLHQMYHSFIKVVQAWNLLIWVLYSKTCMKQRWMTSMTCKNAWCKTCFVFDRNIIDAVVTIWDHVYITEVDTLNTCSDMNVHLHDSSAHFMKLSMSFDACNGYFEVSTKSWSCAHMHFRFFDFHKVV